ncbi:hypothetical protein CRN84_21745 [Budvicia aquatica]|uniref:Lysozyme inhibitor n=2 Tax=Budvicia aquatica TaxID=82979 RepID=A0A2C6DTV6_9GAMM|nr:hypothetical protein CRN84_21745 [Budvicia aquatica]
MIMMKKILLGAVLCGLSTYTCANDDIVFQCTLKQDREKIEVIRHDKGIYVSYMTPQEAKMDEGGRHLSLTLGSDIIEQSVAGNTSQGFRSYTLKFQSDEMAQPHYIGYEWIDGKYSASYYTVDGKGDTVNLSDCQPKTIKADGLLLSSGIDGIPEIP